MHAKQSWEIFQVINPIDDMCINQLIPIATVHELQNITSKIKYMHNIWCKIIVEIQCNVNPK